MLRPLITLPALALLALAPALAPQESAPPPGAAAPTAAAPEPDPEPRDERTARFDAISEQLTRFQRELDELTLDVAASGIDPATAAVRLAELAARAQESRLEQLVARARQDALERLIAERVARLEAEVASDGTIRSLEENLAAQQQVIETAVRPGSMEELEFRAKLLEARLALADRRAAIAERNGLDLVRTLEREAALLVVRIREAEARSEGIEAMRRNALEKLREYRAAAERIEMASRLLQRERSRLMGMPAGAGGGGIR